VEFYALSEYSHTFMLIDFNITLTLKESPKFEKKQLKFEY